MREKTHLPQDRSFWTGKGPLLACCRTGLKRVRDVGRRGTAVVEFAVMAPVLFMVLFGVIEFGLALNQYLTLTNAVPAGAGARTAPDHG